MTSDEPYGLSLAAPASRALTTGPPRGIAAPAAAAIAEFLTGALLAEPHRAGKPLEREFAGYRAARRGPYRIVCRIDEDKHVVHVVRIDHRADVYRPR